MNYFNAFQNYNFIYQANLFRDTGKVAKKVHYNKQVQVQCYKCSHPTQYLTTDTQL